MEDQARPHEDAKEKADIAKTTNETDGSFFNPWDRRLSEDMHPEWNKFEFQDV